MKGINKLHITIIQADLRWGNSVENKKQFQKKINQITDKVDVIILPKIFTTKFSMNTSLAETMNGKTILWMQKLSKNTAITGSIIIVKDNLLF